MIVFTVSPVNCQVGSSWIGQHLELPVSQTIAEQFLYTTFFSVKENSIYQTRPLLLDNGSVIRLTCSLQLLLPVDKGLHGHSDHSAATQPHIRQAVIDSVLTPVYHSNLCQSGSSAGLDQTDTCINESSDPVACSLVVDHFLYLSLLQTTAYHEHPQKICCFGCYRCSDPVVQPLELGHCKSHSDPYTLPFLLLLVH